MKDFIHKHLLKIRLFSRIIFIFLITIISYIAFLPNYDNLPEFTSLSDILNHFMAFLILALFLDLGFSAKIKNAIFILVCYGFFIEVVQHYLPNRVFDLLDVLVDTLGVAFYYYGRKLFFFVN